MKNIWKYYQPTYSYEKEYGDLESAWIGHRYFSYDLVRNLKPQTIVELGTHKGGSFFSFCQAVKDAKLKTKLFAIDTWKGDKHTGAYDSQMYKHVKEIKNKLYPNQNIKLLRKTFDETKKNFKDNSIDILHIDGFHTYKAVKHDFDNWSKKVKSDGLIFLHDTHEKKSNFGVHLLWAELKKTYQTIEFSHSHGLGIIIKNNSPLLKKNNFKQIWQNYYPLLHENKQLKKQTFDQQNHITNITKIHQEKLTSLNYNLKTKKEILSTKREQLTETRKELKSAKQKLGQTGEEICAQINKQTKKIDSLKLIVKEQRKMNRENSKRIDTIDLHAQNLQKILDNVTSAKTFKVWQLYTKIRRKPSLILKGTKILITKGPRGLRGKLIGSQTTEQKITNINEQYQIWLKQNIPTKQKLVHQRKKQKKFKYRPKISIITPVYNTDQKWLEACIKSVLNQTYDNWELCLADDASTKPHVKQVLEKYKNKDQRIKVVYRTQNGHISRASNSALKLATGEYVALMDHDDELTPHALYEIAKLLNEDKNIDFIYSDEDKLELDGRRVDPFFKPDWSPEMFMSVNYLCHLSVIKKTLITKVGGFRVGFEGSQDYDLFLRTTQIAQKIVHVPDILYSWRKVPKSTASVYEVKNYANTAAQKALKSILKTKGQKGSISNGIIPGTFRVKYKIKGNPTIDIIIPTKDKLFYLKRTISSILKKTSYKNYNITIVDTQSTEKETLKYYKKIKGDPRIRFLHWKKIFNFAAVNNFAVKKSKSDYVLLLNNDTEIINSDWIQAMLEYAQNKEIACVGAKLLYPNELIQHAGVVLGIRGGDIKRGIAGHTQKMSPDLSAGLPVLNSKDTIRNYSAVTAACLLISRKKYLEVGGMDEKFRIAFNDVDFCLRLLKKGYRNVYTPFANLYHHESISVGDPSKGSRNLEEFAREIQTMHQRWGETLQNDPFFNPNLSLKNEQINLNI